MSMTRLALFLLAGVGLFFPNFLDAEEISDNRLEKVSFVMSETVETEGYNMLSISPNGKYLAGLTSGDQLAIYDIGQKNFLTVVAFPYKSHIDKESLSWSPDSMYIAFTENSFMSFEDSDIWVLDIKNGKIKNLTYDGFEGSMFSVGNRNNVYVDILPRWGTQSDRIYFVRSGSDFTQSSTEFYRVDIQSPGVDFLMKVDDNPLAVTRGIQWAPENNVVFYTLMGSAWNYPQNGIWKRDLDGKNASQIIRRDNKLGNPIMYQVSPDHKKIIVTYTDVPLFGNPEIPKYYLYDIEEDTLEPLVHHPKEKNEETIRMENMTFSPDGSFLLYIFYRENKSVVSIEDLNSRETKILLDLGEIAGIPFAVISGGLNWVANNTVFVKSRETNRAMIYRIEGL